MGDNQVLKLTIRNFISINHYLAYRTIMKNGKPMAMSYKTIEAKRFQKEFIEYIKQQAILQEWKTDKNPMQHYYVDAVFYFPRIDMDTNNYWKVPFDAITDSGIIWVDDNMACERVIKVLYDSNDPRIEYTIYKTNFTGIFESEKIMTSFENSCKTCKRYKKNCSILKKAKEGRVQKEIDMSNTESNICNKYKNLE